jgi:hypothetical protein
LSREPLDRVSSESFKLSKPFFERGGTTLDDQLRAI